MSPDGILANLNASQKAAVSSSAQTVAILAGPGSGKTHTLTSRTAWLLTNEGLQPWNIIVATFTVKAAREMKERIGKLIGDGLESKLILGTFHSIARRYLARYGHLINIPKDFGIADSSDSLAIIKRIVKRHSLTIDAAAARSRISSQKAKGSGYVPFGNATQKSKSLEVQEIQTCYTEYEEALKRSNLLDYDDLLLRCVDLLRAYPSCVSNIEAVLIDEFQDTNVVQFDLMRLFVSQGRRLTIVGDPDQSIYGFRSAETKNFKRMLKQYPETVTIPLEENYRSSGAILLTALEVIQQDEGRISKSLMPTHNVGTRPVLRKLSSAQTEAKWVVGEIQRCMALTGDLMTFDDFAVLLRSASLSRQIESSLGKAGIAYRMVGGHRFFDRIEVKIVLDYLRVIHQPNNNDALARVVNVPPRQVGDITLKSLLEEAEQSSITLWELVLQHIRGIRNAKTKMANKTEQGLSAFANLILTARKKFLESEDYQLSIPDLIDHIIRKISLEEFLQKCYPEDHESRWSNVEELKNQALDFTNLMSAGQEDEETLPEVEGLQQSNASNPLSRFLANIALASDVKADQASPPIAQVTISTIHAAKGLEWPVVFIPAAYEGSIPHSRAEDADEERRLLYVAMTRAKALLYMSYPKANSRGEQTVTSPFLKPPSLKPFLEEKGPSFTSHVTQSIAQVLHRPFPKIDFELLQSLDTLEDDQFPLDGSTIEERDRVLLEGGAGNQHRHSQRPHKRQRVDEGGGGRFSGETWQPSYTTTMDQMNSFPTAITSITSGFISAGSHLKELNQKSINSIIENRGSRHPVSLQASPNGCTQLCIPRQRISTSLRATQRPEGQMGISRFFLQPPARNPSHSIPKDFCSPRKLEREDPPSIRQPVWSTSKPISAPGNATGIPPPLANRRLRSAALPAPNRYGHEEGNSKKRHYGPLWSSPPPPEENSQNDNNLSRGPANLVGKGDINSGNMSAPVLTQHETTMDQFQKKTYGVKRDLKTWSGGGLKPFKPPSILRPS